MVSCRRRREGGGMWRGWDEFQPRDRSRPAGPAPPPRAPARRAHAATHAAHHAIISPSTATQSSCVRSTTEGVLLSGTMCQLCLPLWIHPAAGLPGDIRVEGRQKQLLFTGWLLPSPSLLHCPSLHPTLLSPHPYPQICRSIARGPFYLVGLEMRVSTLLQALPAQPRSGPRESPSACSTEGLAWAPKG